MAKHSLRRFAWGFLNPLCGVSLCLAIPLFVNAQALPKANTLTIEDGLGFRDVTAVVQDKQGLMWIGTRQGLNRYDGYRFTRFGNDRHSDQFFPGSDILIDGIHVINDSTLLVVADRRLYSINLKDFTNEDITSSAEIGGDVLQLKTTEDGSIWVVWKDEHHHYLCRSTGDTPCRLIGSEVRGRRDFTNLALDRSGNAWWSTVNGGLKQFNPQGEVLHESKPDSFLWYGTKMFNSALYVDSRDRVFVCPKSKYEIWLYHPLEKRIEVIADSMLSPTYHAVEDKLGNVWFFTKTEMLRWNQDRTWTDFSEVLSNALQFSSIRDFYEDETHLLWVATDNGIVTIPIQRQIFTRKYSQEGVAWGNAMRGIFDDQQGNIFAFCERGNVGLHHATDNGTIEQIFVPPAQLPRVYVLDGAQYFIRDREENSVWTLTDHLINIDLNTFQIKRTINFKGVAEIFLPTPFIQLRDGKFLLGSVFSRLTIYDPDTEERTALLQDTSHFTSLGTKCFLEGGESNLWIGTLDKGLFLLSRDGQILQHLTTKTTPALGHDHILSLYLQGDSLLWIGTFGGGLDRYNLRRGSIENFAQEDGLTNDNITGILSDEEGNIWVSTYNGLSCFLANQEGIQNFYEEDGLTNNEFNYASFFKDRTGKLWFGGMNGINGFDPLQILNQRQNPPLTFTSFSKYNRMRDTLETIILGLNDLKEINISPYDSYFQCQWTLPNYFRSDKNRYFVWLEGLDQDWTYVGNNPTVRYHKLPPGHYTLHIKGADSKGNWSSAELAIPVHVRPFFYATWWFILACILLIGSLTYAFVRYRLQRLLEMERMRTRIAGDLHDEVGSILSGIAMQAEILEMNETASDPAKLRRLSEISRLALSKMRDVVWSIDSRRDKVKNLLDRMRENAEEMLTPKEITFQFELGTLLLEKKIQVDVRQHLYLFFKEAITNISKHSNATAVTIRFGQFDEHFELSIHDNGTCTRSSAPSSGFGLQNMEIRAKKLGAKYDLNRDNGFQVSLRMKSL